MRARGVLVFVLLAVAGLSAQTFRGTILGTVTDPSGAVIAGAKVTVKNTGTGLERSPKPAPTAVTRCRSCPSAPIPSPSPSRGSRPSSLPG